MFLFIIGPSNVGKSSNSERYAQRRGCDIIDSDVALERHQGVGAGKYFNAFGPKLGFEASLSAVERDLTELGDRDALIVVGAGMLSYASLNFDPVAAWLTTATSLCLMDRPAAIVKRDPLRRNLVTYKRNEFDPVRLRVYALASRTLNINGRGCDEVYLEFESIVDELRAK